MRPLIRRLAVIGLALTSACASEGIIGLGPGDASSLRVVNGFTAAVDVLVDGQVAIAGLAAGSIGLAPAASGTHTVLLRSAGAQTSSQTISTAIGSVSTLAAVRSQAGGLASVALDDTNSVVPVNATKLRVLHMAPNAGTLQVYRTQPDYQTPVSWQFPFTYQSNPTNLSAPFYQSTVGTWEVRIWQTPADPSGWTSAPVKVSIPLGSGDKKTVVILDNPAGGVRVELL